MKNFKILSILILSFVMLIRYQSNGQIGDQFPLISGTTLTDKDLIIPQDSKGKFTLVGMAYSKKSEDDLKTWFNPIYKTFIYKAENSLFGDFGYDVNVYFIPMFTGVKKAVAGKAEKEMKKKTDPKLLPHILFYKGDLKTYKDALDFEHKDTPYFFVLDKQGKIIYATTGAYSKNKMQKVEELVEEW